jgi:drug/metabolite transporter (DMT)-like permease
MLLRVAPALFVVLWSSGFIGTKLGVADAEAFTFLSIRFVLVLAILTPVALYLARGPMTLTLAQRGHAIVAGALLHAAYLGGITWGVGAGVDANIAALIASLQPILTAVLAGLFLAEAITARHWGGLALGLFGTLLVIWPKIATGAAIVGAPWAGLSAIVFALFAMTLGTIYQKRYCAGIDLVGGAVWQFLGALLVVAPLSLAFETRVINWTPGLVFAFAWLVLVLSLGAISLLMLLIRENAVSRTSALFYLVPGTTAVMAYAVFGETLAPVQLVGLVIVSIAVILMQAAPTPATQPGANR